MNNPKALLLLAVVIALVAVLFIRVAKETLNQPTETVVPSEYNLAQ